MELPENTGGSFEPCPQGTHMARCYRFIDLGSHEQTYQGENKGPKRLVLLSFELPNEAMDDGRPFTISKRYTWSTHEKSTLRHDLESWRGKRFIDADFGPGGFDIKNVLGKPCTITVTHRENGGSTYANITAIGAPMKGVTMPEQINDTVYVSLVPARFDRAAFDGLSDGLKQKIQASPEWQRMANGNGRDTSYARASGGRAMPKHDEMNPPPMDELDDEIPF